jgi:hypothetical protein
MASRLRKLSYFLRSPRNRFPSWRAGTTTLFDLPARQTINNLAESIPWKSIPGLLKRLQIRTRFCVRKGERGYSC